MKIYQKPKLDILEQQNVITTSLESTSEVGVEWNSEWDESWRKGN